LAFGKTIINTTGSLKALLFRLVMNKKPRQFTYPAIILSIPTALFLPLRRWENTGIKIKPLRTENTF
jgi:hypothetical protein